MTSRACAHLTAIKTVKQPKRHECEECVKTGDRWVHLRICQNAAPPCAATTHRTRHASEHARASGHPVIASAEAGERWLYCYPDEEVAEY